MRIAYVTPNQAPTVLSRRPIIRNRSVSNTIKIEWVAKLLQTNSHDELTAASVIVGMRTAVYSILVTSGS